MLRSERFSSVKEKIDGVHVFLCTLSMLSHPLLKKFTKYTPIHILVVDEASQIATKDYLTVINSFHRTLKRMVFIGDPQQCECLIFLNLSTINLTSSKYLLLEETVVIYRAYLRLSTSNLSSYSSILNVSSSLIILYDADENTDRMPPQIGDFISKAVYDSCLLSWDKHKITSRTTAVHFIDVVGGIGVRPPTGGTSSIVSLLKLHHNHTQTLNRIQRRRTIYLSLPPRCRRLGSTTESSHHMMLSVSSLRLV
jgi:superfamily I DNA and/or RNA helicase